MKRREFLQTTGTVAAAGNALSIIGGCGKNFDETEPVSPNVILIMTDDQGYGDLGCHGNELIQTPNIDQLAQDSIECERFYVSPTCAPTRAGLLTGRYHHRTCVQGTMSGEALIHPDEVTMADIFGSAGYRTGIFGKWHLGDNYPRRTVDMGFDEALVHNGGGLSQPSCPPGVGYSDPEHLRKHNYIIPDNFPHWISSNNYFDPVLQHNGVSEQYEGYCTDIFFDAAMEFLEENRERPFFLYIPTNAPHAPEIIGEDYLEPYRNKGLDDKTARGYAMITNIDDNFGRLLSTLKELGLEENTIVIFMTDNGPQYLRYTSGLRGRKSHFYEGGIRVPFFIRWPERLETGITIDTIAANIDVLPTLLDACGIDVPSEHTIDGKSLMPLLIDKTADWPDRTIYFQGNNGVPELYNKCVAMKQRYKLLDGKELYDITEDPSEKNDIAGKNQQLVSRMRSDYEVWFDDVVTTRGQEPQRLYIGAPEENPVVLTPQDWRGSRSRFVKKGSLGHWLVDVRTAGAYEVTVRFRELEKSHTAHFSLGSVMESRSLKKGEESVIFTPLHFHKGEFRLDAFLKANGNDTGVAYVEVRLL